MGRGAAKRKLCRHFRKCAARRNPSQTRQRLQDAAKTGSCKGIAKVLEERMRTIGHFIGGREVKGTSGRFADVFEPMTGDVQAKVALASKAELRAAVENAKAGPAERG